MDNKARRSRAGNSGKYKDHYNFGSGAGQPMYPEDGRPNQGQGYTEAPPERPMRSSPYAKGVGSPPSREIRPPAQQPIQQQHMAPPVQAPGNSVRQGGSMPVGMPEQFLQNNPQGAATTAASADEPTHVRAKDAQSFEPTRVRTGIGLQKPLKSKRTREDTHVLEIPSFMREGARYSGHKKTKPKPAPQKSENPKGFDVGPLEIPSFMKKKNAQPQNNPQPQAVDAKKQRQNTDAPKAASGQQFQNASVPPVEPDANRQVQHDAKPQPGAGTAAPDGNANTRPDGQWAQPQNNTATPAESDRTQAESAPQPSSGGNLSEPKSNVGPRPAERAASSRTSALYEQPPETAEGSQFQGVGGTLGNATKKSRFNRMRQTSTSFLDGVVQFFKKAISREESMQGTASLTANDKPGKQKVAQRFDAGALDTPSFDGKAVNKDHSLRPGSFALRSRVGRLKDDPDGNAQSWQEKVENERRIAARESAARERNKAAAKGRVAASIGRENQIAESQLNYKPRIARIKNRRQTSAHRVKSKRRNREIVAWVLSITFAIMAALLIRAFVFEIILVDGNSMLPTLHSDERVAIEKVSRYGGMPDYGDIVIVEYPNLTGTYVKRTIGLPGDTVEVRDSTVYVNGQALDEPYVSEDKYQDMSPVVVPEDHFFVMGDNRAHSLDSRTSYIGPISKDALIGHGLFVIWPFDSMHWIQ